MNARMQVCARAGSTLNMGKADQDLGVTWPMITERAPINGACSLSAERLRARHTHLKTLLVRCGGPRAVAAG